MCFELFRGFAYWNFLIRTFASGKIAKLTRVCDRFEYVVGDIIATQRSGLRVMSSHSDFSDGILRLVRCVCRSVTNHLFSNTSVCRS